MTGDYKIPLDEREKKFQLRLTASDIAKRLNVSREVVVYWIRSGRLKARKLTPGKRTSPYIISPDDYQDFLDRYIDDPSDGA